jgi:hypothetical protein
MSWTLVVWWALSMGGSSLDQGAMPSLLGLPGYATQQDCILAGKSLPQNEFNFYCIPGASQR